MKRQTAASAASSQRWWLLAAVAAAAVIGVQIPRYPWLVALVLLPIGALAISSSALARFSFFTFGGLLILQSSAGLGAPKLAYFAGCAVAFTFAFVRVQVLDEPALLPIRRAGVGLSLAWAALVLISFPVAMTNGSTPMDWLRDAIPYLLIAAVPYIALDVLVDLRRHPASPTPERMFVLYGFLASVGFFTNWVTKRGFAELGFEGLFFSTFAVPAAIFSFAVAGALSGPRHRTMWALLATAVLALVLLTGTRSSLILLAAPATVVLGQGGGLVRQIPRIVAYGIMIVAAGSVLYLLLPSSFGIDPAVIAERFLSITDLTGNSVAGQSFGERETVTGLTWEAWKSAPVFGLGPGHLYQWSVPFGTGIASSFTLDSPLSVPAKFGALGLLVYFLTLGGLYALQRYLNAFGPALRVQRDMIRGFLAITICLSLLGSPIDDKGFSFALAFLLILVGQGILRVESEKRAHATTGFHPDPVVQPGRLAA
jgi:hypothetical protein